MRLAKWKGMVVLSRCACWESRNLFNFKYLSKFHRIVFSGSGTTCPFLFPDHSKNSHKFANLTIKCNNKFHKNSLKPLYDQSPLFNFTFNRSNNYFYPIKVYKKIIVIFSIAKKC